MIHESGRRARRCRAHTFSIIIQETHLNELPLCSSVYFIFIFYLFPIAGKMMPAYIGPGEG